MSPILTSGTKAPAFALRVTPDQTLSLSEFAGRRLILAFYPADWSPVCGDQMTLYNHVLSEFRKRGAELVGISVDGPWCHQAFARDRNLHFPLLSDFHPKGEVSLAYGVYRDENGTIAWSHLSPVAVNPGADGILDALDQMPNLEQKNVDAQSSRQPA
jgi:peroxiredoxin